MRIFLGLFLLSLSSICFGQSFNYKSVNVLSLNRSNYDTAYFEETGKIVFGKETIYFKKSERYGQSFNILTADYDHINDLVTFNCTIKNSKFPNDRLETRIIIDQTNKKISVSFNPNQNGIYQEIIDFSIE